MEKELTIQQKLNEMIKAATSEGFMSGLEFAIEIIQKTIEQISKENGK